MLNSLSDAVLVTSTDGIVKSCNEATQKLLGYQESDLIGKPLTSFVDEVHRNAFDSSHSAPEARETVLRTASGQTIPVSMASSSIDTDDPQFQGSIYVARNITERKRAERRIRYLARYDTLTKMPNRMQFQHLLQQAIARARRNQRSLALLYLDLDRFKGSQRHLRPCRRRPHAGNPERTPDEKFEQGQPSSAAWPAMNSRCSSTICPWTSTIAPPSARSPAPCWTR